MPLADELEQMMGVPTGRLQDVSADPLEAAFGITNADRQRFGTDIESRSRRTPYVLRHSIPFMSAVGNATEARIGTPEARGMQQARDEEHRSTWGGYLGDVVAGLPAVAGEAYFGGRVVGMGLRAIGMAAPATQALPGLLSRAGVAARAGQIGRSLISPGAYVRTAAQTAAMPSMYLEDWAQRGGRLQDMPPAFAMGFLNTAVLGRVGAGEGNLAQRLFRGIPVGLVEQQAVDAIGSAVSEFLPASAHLQTGYGLIGDLVHGRGNEFMRHGLGQAMTFGIFAGMHGGDHQAVPEAAAALTRQAKRQGLSAEGAGKMLMRSYGPLAEAMRAHPDMSRQEALAIVNEMPAGPQRTFAEAVANVLPEHYPGFGPTPGIDPPINERGYIPRGIGQMREVSPGVYSDRGPGGPPATPPVVRDYEGRVVPPRTLQLPPPRAEQPANAPGSSQASAPPQPIREPNAPEIAAPAAAQDARPAVAAEPAPVQPATPTDPVRQKFEAIPLPELRQLATSLLSQGGGIGKKKAAVKKPGWVQKASPEELVSSIIDAGGEPLLRAAAGVPVERPAAEFNPPVPEPPAPAAPVEPPKPAEPPQPAAPQPIAEVMRDLLQRHEAGQAIGSAEFTAALERSDLKPNHRADLVAYLGGKTMEEIGKARGVSREAVRQLIGKAAKAMGLDSSSVFDAVHKVARADRVADAVDAGKVQGAIEPDAMEAVQRRATESEQFNHHIDSLYDALEKLPAGDGQVALFTKLQKELERKNGSLTQRRLAYYAAEIARLAGPGEGQGGGGADAPAPVPESARADAGSAPAPAEAAAGVSPQASGEVGNAESAPAPQQPARRPVTPAVKKAAIAANVLPSDLQQAVEHVMAQDPANGEVRDMLRYLYQQHPELKTIKARNARGIDADAVRGLDDIAYNKLPTEFRHLLPGPDKENQLFELLVKPMPEPMSQHEAIEQAVEFLKDQQRQQAEEHEENAGHGDERGGSAVDDEVAPGVFFRQQQAPVSQTPGEPTGFTMPAGAEQRSRVALGGGQEAAPTARPEKTTALANVVTEQERRINGLAELNRATRLANRDVWDAALAEVHRDPKAAEKVVADLEQNQRPASVQEDGLLLQRRVTLANDYENAILDGLTAFHELSRARRAGLNTAEASRALDQAEAKVDAAKEQIDRLDRVIKATGTEQGRALAYRRQLVQFDYSLAGMLQRAEVAKRKPLTHEERQQIVDMQTRIDQMQKQLDQAEAQLKQAGTGAQGPAYEQWSQAKLQARQAQIEFDRRLGGFRWEAMTPAQRAMSTLRKVYLNFLISSPTTAAKVGAASIEQLAVRPVHEAIGEALKMIPGIARIAARTPIEGGGFNAATEQRVIQRAATQGLKDAKDTVTTGMSELDTKHGSPSERRTFLDWIGDLHSAEKAPAVRAEYERAVANLTAAEQAAGRDVATPAAIEAIEQRAYNHSLSAKFQQDNAVVKGMDKFISGLKANESPVLRGIGHGLDFMLPIRRIPTNIVFDAFEHALGVPYGSLKLAMLGKEGRANISEVQAEAIMRQLKRGSLGLPLLILGASLGPSIVGGFFNGSRTKDEPGAGEIGGLPAWLAAHHPAALALQVGGHMHRMANAQTHGEEHGVARGIAEGLTGLLDEVPFVREQTEVGRLMEGGNAVNRFVGSRAMPQLVQWVARNTDTEEGTPFMGERQQRRPDSLVGNVGAGVPGLRQQTTEGPPRVVRDYHLELTRARQERQNVVRRGLRDAAVERRYAILERAQHAIANLEHQATGQVQTPRGLVQREAPDADRVRQLRERQADLAQRVLEAARR